MLTARGFRPLAGPAVRWAARRGTTPAATARAGGVLTVVAAVWFTDTTLLGDLVGALLLALVLYSDAVGDRLGGQARDRLTEWTVAVMVHLREFALYAGLALGAGLAGRADAWLWASGALIAYALRESVVTARGVGPSPSPGGGDGAHPSPIDVVDPSRSSREPADPEFTAELLGVPAADGDDAEPGGLVRIRTAPPRRGGGLRPLERGGVRPGPAPQRRPRAPLGRGSDTLRALTAFAPSERLLVIAVSVTIWDALAAFAALIAGSAVAVAAAVTTPRRDAH